MEKAARVAVAPVAVGSSDVGSWDALHELGGKEVLILQRSHSRAGLMWEALSHGMHRLCQSP